MRYPSTDLKSLLIALCFMWTPWLFATQQEPPHTGEVEATALMAHLGAPSRKALGTFKRAGMKDVRPHILSASELEKVNAAFASLPVLNRHVLEIRLRHLAFVDGIRGEGTGLTSRVSGTGLYDITLRASILEESLSTFLTNKERRVFTDEGDRFKVEIQGTGADALTYVLLHESTHVVDMSCGITAKPGSRFVAGIWTGERTLVSSLASSASAMTIFRGAVPISVDQAASVYNALAETPFVSLYATASASEDFAELVSWHQIKQRRDGDLAIFVKDRSGQTVDHWSPLTYAGVQPRFAALDELLASLDCASFR